MRESRRNVDHAPARLAQRLDGGRRHAPGAQQVDVDHAQGVLAWTLGGALRIADAGAVDQHVEPAELLDRLRNRGVNRVLIAHVALDDLAAAVAVEAGHLPATPPQLGGGRLADAAGSAGDQHTAAHARTSTGASVGWCAGTRRYSDGVKLFTAEKNLNVWSGHSVEFLPLRSMYQLLQPPFSHTVPADLRWIVSFHRSCISWRGSIAATPARSMCSSAWRM